MIDRPSKIDQAAKSDQSPHDTVSGCAHLHDVYDLEPKTISSRLEEAKLQCQSNGVRFTTLRQQIYKMILQAQQPVGAYDLITELQQARTQNIAQSGTQSKNVAPPTVYRSLDFLLQQGLIHQLTSLNAYIPCCHPRSQHTAAFFICESCQHVQECSSLPVQEVMNYAKEDVGFEVSQSVIELRGVCQSCQLTSSATS